MPVKPLLFPPACSECIFFPASRGRLSPSQCIHQKSRGRPYCPLHPPLAITLSPSLHDNTSLTCYLFLILPSTWILLHCCFCQTLQGPRLKPQLAAQCAPIDHPLLEDWPPLWPHLLLLLCLLLFSFSVCTVNVGVSCSPSQLYTLLLDHSIYNHGFNYYQIPTTPQSVAQAKIFLLCFDLHVL